MAERIYRDPVHNIISLEETDPDDRLLVRLIDTPEFQRLRRIRQLGLALFTYQGAEHSRFSHSLGVMHLMRRVLALLGQRYSIDREVRLTAMCAALLHDVGHGPFSHVMETVLGYRHEEWGVRIILDEGTLIHRLLSERDRELPARVVAVLQHTYRPRFISQLISSQMDVDRFDYLLRDSLMTGAKYGFYDLEWILHTLEIAPEQECLYVAAKGLYAVEEYLQARYYMFRQVYFHRNLRAAEAMLRSIFRRAIDLMASDRLQHIVPDSVMAKVLRRESLSTEEYLALDDHDIMFHIKWWTKEPDPILSDLASRFLHRRLFKSVDVQVNAERRRRFLEQARRIVEAAGFDPRYYLVEDRASDIPYLGPYSPETSGPENRIYVEANGGSRTLREITEVSPAIRRLRRFHIDRLCFPEAVSETIRNLVEQEEKG
ncbi:MAG: HD domain-containing protein [Blastocatellia bacterium]|nr:HD domain-containing protein [Blastocatellia bacterium]MDW8255751.1 HD domain-containing protein [Acidobacteriota bacterium]